MPDHSRQSAGRYSDPPGAHALLGEAWLVQHARNVMEKPIGTDLASAHALNTRLFQIVAFMAMEPPTALDPAPIGEEKNKVIRSILPIDPTHRVRDQSDGYRGEAGVDPESETETVIALKCLIDKWR